MLKRLFVIALILTASCAFAQTAKDQPATKEDVMRFFKTLRVENQINNVFVVMGRELQRATDERMQSPAMQKLTPEKREKLKSLLGNPVEAVLKLYPISEIMSDIAPVYTRYYTKGDIDQIVAFYETPTGEKFLNKSPEMIQEAADIMMPKMRSRVADYNKQLEAQIDEIMKDDDSAKPGTDKKK